MTGSGSKEDVIKYWWVKSHESLESAERDIQAQAYNFAISRIYYSAFYAVSAALLKKGLSFKKHSGVRATFHKEFIKNGLIESSWGKFYDQLFEDRQEGDYIALIDFDEEYVKEKKKLYSEFLNRIKIFIL